MHKRKYHIGAEIISGKGVDFRVWAPDHNKVFLVIAGDPESISHEMKKEKDGYFSIFIKDIGENSFYYFHFANSIQWLADPASRYQPKGPQGPSCVVNSNYEWSDQHWHGVGTQGHIIYEMHIGTFTEAGTYHAATKELKRLAELGITLIEILPLNDFPGHFGWGYDGVNIFAPTHLYGTPKELKCFINTAHRLGMGVILDVVYNHLGPEGNQMIQFAKGYLSDHFTTDWGNAINFDLQGSRDFFLTNARYWIEEYHFDGLRIDATPWLFSSTPMHILEELSRVVKTSGGERKTIIIGENEPQNTKLLRPYEEGGYGYDMLWNDDFHHASVVRLTGKREAYCFDYLGTPQEFISAIKYGFLYQGQYYSWQAKSRGVPYFSIKPESMVIFLENHDQVANLGGLRLHEKADQGNYKALTALFLLSPNTPMLFQGQEYNSMQPFYYFADHAPDLAPIVRKGRRKEMGQFPRCATAEIKKTLPDPENPLTFIKSKLNAKDREGSKIYTLYRDLINLRKTDEVFKKIQNIKIDGAVLGTDCLVLRYFGEEDGDRVLIVNFGPDYYFLPSPEPLLGTALNDPLQLQWSSESTIYGGGGTPPINKPSWKLLGHSAILLKTKKVV